jgi:hypothetical protein
MRFLVQLKCTDENSSRKRPLRKRTPEERAVGQNESVARANSCAEQVRRIGQSYCTTMAVSPLPNLDMLVVDCPDSALVPRILKDIVAKCADVESVSDDRNGVHAVEDSFHIDGIHPD